jgi:hypothetical protein
MRWWWLLLILILLRARAQADAAEGTPRRPDPQQTAAVMADTVQAATNKAVANLYEQIAPLPLSAAETVGQYVKANNLQDEFREVLRHADQIGGPRWLDDYTAQVRLEIPVARVTYALKQFAAAHPRNSPSPDQIERISKGWPQQVISATGSGTASQRLPNLRPPNGPWRDVPEKVREAALEEARGDAIERAMKGVERVQINPEQTLGDAFANPEIGKAIADWLAARPVTEVDFDEAGTRQQKLVVKVTLGVSPEEYFEQVRATLEGQKAISLPKADEEWDRVRKEFLAAFQPAQGRATAKVEPPQVGSSNPRVNSFVPTQRQAPTWVGDDIAVQGTAPTNGTSAAAKLKARQKAETDARDALRTRIDSLQFDDKTTIGQAAKQDARVEAAVRRAIDRTRPSKTDYRSDGTVVVHFVHDLRDLWDQLRRF